MECLFKLKWLNGPLTGRELDLPSGEIQLGGSDADIALSLEQDVSTLLSVSAGGITLAPAVPVWVEGKPWDTGQPLPCGKAIDLAGQGLVLGEAGRTLSSLSLPPRLSTETADKLRGSNRWLGWLAAAALLTLLVLAGVKVVHNEQQIIAPFNPHYWLEQRMKDPELAGLEAHIDQQGIVHLSGLNASSGSIAQLREQLRDHGLHFYDQSMGSDTLIQQVRQILALHGYHNVEVISGSTPDSVEIHGAINGDAAWLRTSARLQQINTLKHWKVINDQAELFSRLLAKLEQHDVLEGVSIQVIGKELLINGQLDQARTLRLTQLASEFNHEGAPRLKARFLNIPNGVTSNLLPAAVVAVGGNKQSVYLQLANNMRLQQGAVLPNGYKIYALSHSSLSLIRGERLVSLPFHL